MLEKLVEYCSRIQARGKNVIIQTHNYPDVDAIASAWGLQYILSVNQISSKIVYLGEVDRISTEHLVSLYKIELNKHDGNFTDDDFIVCIDCQKNEGNVTHNGGRVFACVDHHPDAGKEEYKFSYIRSTGACSSIIANELFKMDIEIPSQLATALLYGIKMDTLQFSRGVKEFDILAYQRLYKNVNDEMLHYLETSNLKLDDLVAYGDAIKNIIVVSDIATSYVPFDCPDGLIASLSEFMLSVDELSISIVFSKRESGIKLSVRSILPYVDAGKLTREALDGIGNGGGHAMFAGGFVPIDNIRDHSMDIQKYLTDRFLHCYGKIMMDDK